MIRGDICLGESDRGILAVAGVTPQTAVLPDGFVSLGLLPPPPTEW